MSDAKAGKKTGTDLVPQKHGGAIYQGTPRNIVPGPGRPPEQFRAVARRLLHNRKLLHRLADIADARIGEIKEVTVDGAVLKIYTETPIREQRGAIAELAKIAIPQVKELSTEDVKDRLRQTIALIRSKLPPDQAESLLSEIEPIWH